MKRNFNIIQIHGIRGIIVAVCIVCCLAVGFIAFPGWVSMQIWNSLSAYIDKIPTINIVQGVLLWGIIAISYFVFRKNKLVVCMKSSQELSEEELKEVFANIKRQSEEDPVLKAMLKARDAELKKQLSETNIENQHSEKNESIKENNNAPFKN